MDEPEVTAPVPASVLGIDIGGTKVAVCVGTAAGEVLAERRLRTAELGSPQRACDAIAAVADELVAAELAAGRELAEVVGVSAPGPLSAAEGRFLNPPNNPGWHGFEVVAELERRLGRRVLLMNDANAAAWAEWRFGAGRGTQTMVFLTMSTGMGAGLVIGGRLHEGADDMAGEVGHLRLREDGPVGFGVRGSLEGYCSGPGIAQLAVLHLHRARHQERRSVLLELERDFRTVDAEDVGRAARAGDAVALEVLHETGTMLGRFCAGLVDLLNPDAIVVGTIGRIYHDLVLPPARAEIDRLAHPRAAARVALRPAALGEATGPLAAISVVLARGAVS